MGGKCDCFRGAFSACGRDVNPVTAIVGQGWPKVPAGDTVWRPGGSLGGGLVREDAAAWWTQRGLVEIKRAIDLCVSGETRVDV